MHQAMTELQWTPKQIGQLTLPQLVCLTHKEPPKSGNAGAPITDMKAFLKAQAEAEAAKAEAWSL